jgi:hypothetical protein
MKTTVITAVAVAFFVTPLAGQDSVRSQRESTRELKDRADRGKLHDAAQMVRGDSGKWNDDPILQIVSLEKMPPKMSLDDWCDRLRETEIQLTSDEDVWLVFRSRQLNDNDRIWIERIARRGSQIEVFAGEAVWQGRYFKNFTYYNVLAVNLGKLDPGRYEAHWTIKPLAFNKFDRPGPLTEAWPQDERPAEEKIVELTAAATISAAAP